MQRALMFQLLMMLVTMPPGQGLVMRLHFLSNVVRQLLQGHGHDVRRLITAHDFSLNQSAREVHTSKQAVSSFATLLFLH